MNMFAKILYAAGVTLFVVTLQAHAQINEPQKDIQLSTFPKHPGANETVRIEAQSFSFDIRTTPLTWLVDSSVKESGVGKTSFSMTTKAIGISTTVTIKAVPVSGILYENSITITPSYMEVLWHTNSYTPPWYRGKALPARGSIATVTALPVFAYRGQNINPATLTYDWWLDNKLLKNESGRGKSILPIRISSNGNITHNVRVRVEDPKSGITQEKSVELNVQDQKILFYELDPLRGPKTQQAIGAPFMLPAGAEAQFLSVPYYISGNPQFFSHTWSINSVNLDLSGDTNKTILNYQTEVGATTRQTVSLTVQNPAWILEQARGSFQIIVK